MWKIYLKCYIDAFPVLGFDIYQILFTKGVNNQIQLMYAYLYK